MSHTIAPDDNRSAVNVMSSQQKHFNIREHNNVPKHLHSSNVNPQHMHQNIFYEEMLHKKNISKMHSHNFFPLGIAQSVNISFLKQIQKLHNRASNM